MDHARAGFERYVKLNNAVRQLRALAENAVLFLCCGNISH
jgi:hypothetical protein